jgi:hypothetical protein
MSLLLKFTALKIQIKNLDLQNYWVFGLRPPSGILETRKQNFSETRSVSVLGWRGKTPTQLGPLSQSLDKDQKPSNSVCCTPSSEPFKIYQFASCSSVTTLCSCNMGRLNFGQPYSSVLIANWARQTTAQIPQYSLQQPCVISHKQVSHYHWTSTKSS